ncbi:hypothetical protein Xszus_00516 [Xenorhabdus szentirmaii]|nr:hypothetical protein Xsze_03590 [Xenorhabdus szentirmaii DSM 16338]PHM40841.1 hypothetical protein Xszus_00516 [Xenorhabdus szentirmaii]
MTIMVFMPISSKKSSRIAESILNATEVIRRQNKIGEAVFSDFLNKFISEIY